MKRLILLLGTVLVFASCGKTYETYYSRSFVLSYDRFSKISVKQAYDRKLDYLVDFVGEGEWDFRMSGDDKAYYDLLCAKHNDLFYNRKVCVYLNMPDSRCYRDFVKFEVWSSAAWDADHPAGTMLGDIAVFDSNTPWPYIRSGYTRKYAEEKGGEYYPVERLVSELMPEDMTLLPGGGFVFRFTKFPAQGGLHTLFVRLTADDGEVFEADCDVEF